MILKIGRVVMPNRESKFIILGKPVAWARPGKTRFSRDAYDTQKALKDDYKWFLKSEMLAEPLFEGPLHVELKFFMPITLGKEKRKREREGQYHIFASDLDNLIKFVLDAAKDILYTDDRIISSINAVKVWDSTPRTELLIRELS
jgi:Holliday junction resolvase RusA-like endonuclease